ncbi:lateral signaling target protein 2 homolog [Drosophila obscura]|uniref:lateral signaling target protein 2 homolog n=1 Tax=Drosophila obscura TaxID=7282 RepID=UPI001BB1989F|nr:lateral signaling target protein 2 homolog [Drosophila obscura]XP_022230237.2 lateral signaling target protein 2 homolog [Drosophila obscura]XP_022230238.2 lateral signaling target protein 2 homolog [Drosophila obscura]XP_022230239.2 lateral signaling target protein 2 homolog [Drosophila obscura]
MPFGRKSPLEALALPGVMLAYKYSQFRQRRREAASRRVTERELSALHHKIDKLLSKLEEESEPDPPTSQEDECVICINARATMQTSPCGHRVVCRRCFVKTIQSAVAQRLLPLRCVICRARVNRLTSSSGTWRIQESASSYSMGAKSWASAGVAAGGVVASASSYSMNDAHSGHHTFHHQPTLHKAATVGRHHQAVRGTRGRLVSQSDSLYSMSSTGSAGSSLSGYSHYSKTSSISSSGPCSPASAATSSSNHLAPPSPGTHHQHHHHHHHHHRDAHHASTSPTPSGSSGSSLSPRDTGSHSHHGGCPSGCSGAVPRKPLHTLSNCTTSTSTSASSSSGSGSGSSGGSGGSGTMTPMHTYPGRRHIKNRLLDIQNRLPPIKEFRSPAKVPHPSPVHVSNPRFRYASYTKSSTHELAPLLREGASPPPPRRPSPMNIQLSCTTLAPPPLKAGGAKICPVTAKNALPKSAYVMPKDKKIAQTPPAGGKGAAAGPPKAATLGAGSTSKAGTSSVDISVSGSGSGSGTSASSNPKPASSSPSRRSFPLFSAGSNQKERADNKKNESVERKKKEEKLKLKAEKEARKEEKRLAKEEERLAKLHAKEEKKRGKKEAKELLLANDIKK